MKKQVTLYTDGACSGNPGIGGYAGILIYGEIRREYNGGELSTTNNRMEIPFLQYADEDQELFRDGGRSGHRRDEP